MKGITPIISIIILLLITIALAGAAYLFLSGYLFSFTQTVSVDGACTGGTGAFITVTNLGSRPITLAACTPDDSSSTVCGDISVVREDTGGRMSGPTFGAQTSIGPAGPDELDVAHFTDLRCVMPTDTYGRSCTYAFNVFGQTARATVNCRG